MRRRRVESDRCAGRDGDSSPREETDLVLSLLRDTNYKYMIQMSYVLVWWVSFSFFLCMLTMVFPRAEDLRNFSYQMVLPAAFVLGSFVLLVKLQSAILDKETLQLCSKVAEGMSSLITVITSYSMLNTGHIWGSTFLRGFAVFIMPSSRVKQLNTFAEYKSFAAILIGLCLVSLRNEMYDDGWQWTVVCIFGFFINTFTISQKFTAREAALTMDAHYGSIHRLLSMMSDGIVLFDDDGNIVGVDSKASSLLGSIESSSWSPVPVVSAFRSPLDASELQRQLAQPSAMLNFQLRTAGGEFLDVEAYNVTCMVLDSAAKLLLGPSAMVCKHSRITNLCAVRVRQMSMEEDVPGSTESTDLVAFGGEASDTRPQPSYSSAKSSFSPPMLLQDIETITPFDSMSAMGGLEQRSVVEEEGPELQLGSSPLKLLPAMGIGGGEYTIARKVCHTPMTTVMEVKGPDGGTYALKRIKIVGLLWQRDFPRNLRNLDREVRNLKSLGWASPVVVRWVDAWLEADFSHACVVMEWLPLSLESLLVQHSRGKLGPLELAASQRYCGQLALGLQAIHFAGLMHRDLKPSNVLLTLDRRHAKIADLGVSREFHIPSHLSDSFDAKTLLNAEISSILEEPAGGDSMSVLSGVTGYTQRVGTRAYASPESLRSRSYDQRTDVFSLGCILFEMLTLERVTGLRGDPDEELAHAAPPPALAQRLQALAPPGAADGSLRRQLVEACLRMLEPDALKRPTAAELAACAVCEPIVAELLQQHPELQRLAEIPAAES